MVVGVGDLDIASADDKTPTIVLLPTDGRDQLWMDPRRFYRLHDQTVDVYIELTDEAYSTSMQDLMTQEGGAIGNGDGSFQVKNVPIPTSIPPVVKSHGDGLYSFSAPSTERGKRIRLYDGPSGSIFSDVDE